MGSNKPLYLGHLALDRLDDLKALKFGVPAR
jgi:hypothetical protein